jgi:NarL family two-component system response regulator YdfI
MIRTLVSASSALARAGLAAALRGDSRVSVVGEAAPGEFARLAAALEPDVVVERREGSGETLGFPAVVLVDDPRYAWSSEAGQYSGERAARAILSRDASPEEIVAAVVAVAAGLVAVQPQTLAHATAGFEAPNRVRADALSTREIEVLAQLARGAANKKIAGALGISEHTVKFHIASIFAKLGASSRTQAVTQGVRLGLIML